MPSEQQSKAKPLGEYAGFVTRMVAYLVDLLVVSVVLTLVAAVVNFALSLFGLSVANLSQSTQRVLVILAVLVTVGINVAYNIGFWLAAGQTPGKRLMGVRVVRSDGNRLRGANAVLRQLVYPLSTILYLGFLWIIVDNRRQGWHDKVAGTVVIYAWPDIVKTETVKERLHRIHEERQPASGSVQTAQLADGREAAGAPDEHGPDYTL